MAKKKKEKKEDEDNIIEEQPKKDKSELSTITDLLNNVSDKDLLQKLIDSGYYSMYMRELDYKKLNYTITPYVDVDEFYKKMKIKK